MKPDRRYFLVLAALLALVAISRLVHLAWGGEKNLLELANRTHHLKTHFSLQVEGSSGDKIRLFFPEVPLNLDYPYKTGRLEEDVELRCPKLPKKLRCKVLSEGLVVAESELMSVDWEKDIRLARVRVRPLK